MDKLRMQSSNGVEDNIAKIAQLFPDCVTETVDERSGQPKHLIDFEKLKQNLSDSVMSERAERYQFTWPDKSKAILLANSPINATLRPCREACLFRSRNQGQHVNPRLARHRRWQDSLCRQALRTTLRFGHLLS